MQTNKKQDLNNTQKALASLRFVPVVLAAICIVLLCVSFFQQATGLNRFPWLAGMSVASALVAVATLLLQLVYPRWKEQENKQLLIEAAAMFCSVFFAAAIVLVGRYLLLANGSFGAHAYEEGQILETSSSQESENQGNNTVDNSQKTESSSSSYDEQTQKNIAATIRAIDASTLMRYLDASSAEASSYVPIYFGRVGCHACVEFKAQIAERLAQEELVMLHFDTAAETSGDSEQRAEVLESTDVSSVPVVLVFHDGEVVERITSPAKQVNKIVDLVKASGSTSSSTDGNARDDTQVGPTPTQCADGEDCDA